MALRGKEEDVGGIAGMEYWSISFSSLVWSYTQFAA